MSIGHVAPRVVGPRAIRVRDEHDRLFGVIDDVGGEIRLIVDDELDAVLARDVGRGDDDELVPGDGGIERDADVMRPRGDRAAHGDAVQHPCRRQIVDVERLAGDLGAAFLAPDGPADLRRLHWPIVYGCRSRQDLCA